MTQLVSTARNIRHMLDDDGIKPLVELVLTVMTPRYDLAGTTLARFERCETLRFETSPEGARTFAKHLREWADEADAERALIALRADARKQEGAV
jgi:hypothetical protein